jgi:hypothetical protein
MADPLALEEAYRRGILSPEKRGAYEEGVKRGLWGTKPPDVPVAPAQPAPAQHTEQRSIGERIGQGFMDPLYGMAQTGARMQDPGEGIGGFMPQSDREARAAAVDKLVFDREAAISRTAGEGFDWWRAAGTGTNPILYATALGGGLPGAAISGMMAGLMQPVTDPKKDFMHQKMNDAMLGSAFGLGGGTLVNVAGRAVSPIVSRAAQELMNRGVQLTPGRIAGRLISRMEDAAKSIPWLGEFVRNANVRSRDTFNVSVINQMLHNIGEVLPPGVNAGREAVDHANTMLEGRYAHLLSDPRMQMQIDHEFVRDMADIRLGVNELPADLRPAFDGILMNRVSDRMARNGGGLAGQDLQDVESHLGTLARGYQSSSDEGQRSMGRLISQVREAIRDALERQTPPELSGELRDLNRSYAMFKIIQDASTRRVGAGAEYGVFSPTDLGKAVMAGDPSKDKANYARGRAMLQEFSEWGQALLPAKIPDSGTPERWLWTQLMGGGFVGERIAPKITMPTVASLALASAPYSRFGMGLINQYTQPGARRAAVRRGLEASEGAVGALSGETILKKKKFDANGNPASD